MQLAGDSRHHCGNDPKNIFSYDVCMTTLNILNILNIPHSLIRISKQALLIISLLLLSFATPAAQIEVVTEIFPPYQIRNQDGTLGGFSIEVVNAMFKLTGDTADIQVMPWARAYSTAKKHKNTLIFTIAHTQVRDKLFQWVGRLNGEKLYIWGLKSKFTKPFTSLNQLRAYTIATSRHSNPDQYFTSQHFEKLYRLVKPNQNLGMLFTKRVDLIVSSEQSLRKRLDRMQYDFSKMIRLFEIKALNNNLGIAFNLRSDPALVKRYQQAFQKLKDDGVLDTIKAKWSVAK